MFKNMVLTLEDDRGTRWIVGGLICESATQKGFNDEPMPLDELAKRGDLRIVTIKVVNG